MAVGTVRCLRVAPHRSGVGTTGTTGTASADDGLSAYPVIAEVRSRKRVRLVIQARAVDGVNKRGLPRRAVYGHSVAVTQQNRGVARCADQTGRRTHVGSVDHA